MAKTDSKAAARQIISDIRKGELKPVYLLMGEEAYYIDLIVENFEKYVIPDEDKDFNLNIFYGNDVDIDYLVGVAQQFPVMANRKLVLLKEAQSMQMAKSQLEKIAPYVSKPNCQTCLVIVFKGDSLNGTSKLVKAVKEKGVLFKSDIPWDNQVPDFIRDYCREHKFTIEPKAVELLAQYIGLPLSKLYGEINKLIEIKGKEDKHITCVDIEKNIGISKEYNNLELTSALGKKDYNKVITIIKYFEANPKSNPTPVITAVLLNFFGNLVAAHYLPDKSDTSLMNTFGLKSSYKLNDFKVSMKNYNARQAVNAIHHLREFDTKSKGIGSLINEYDLLAELIFKIFT